MAKRLIAEIREAWHVGQLWEVDGQYYHFSPTGRNPTQHVSREKAVCLLFDWGKDPDLVRSPISC